MAKVYENVLSLSEIQSIIDFYNSRPVAAQDYWSRNKNLEYHIPDDFSYQILHAKIQNILGDHEFATGAYKECVNPYDAHVDTYEAHQDTNTIMTFATNEKHKKVLLIPLVEGNGYKTVVFSCWANTNNLPRWPTQWLGDKNNLDPQEFPHENRDLTHLPVDVEYTWKLGDVLSWDRDQLHISADFRRHGVTKKFLILFIA